LDAKTLVFGHSHEAREIANRLLQHGGEVVVATPAGTEDRHHFENLGTGIGSGRCEILPLGNSFSCDGSVGRFGISVHADGHVHTKTASSIVIADTIERSPNYSFYSLGPSAYVVSLSQIMTWIAAGSEAVTAHLAGKRIAFLTGLVEESNPVITEEIMRCALNCQQVFDKQTYLFTRNLKVAANGLEALYRQTKEAGMVYMKFAETIPKIEVSGDGRVVLTYLDEVIRERFQLKPDVTVVDETLQSSALSRDLSYKLRIHTGPDGFIQSDNVHRATVFTNRTGIFVAGFSRGIQTRTDRQADVGNTVQAVLNLYQHPPEDPVGKAHIRYSGHCVGCLTCFRACPYGAISLTPRVTVDPLACEGCGICAAECPRFAITINMPAGENISERIPDAKKKVATENFKPAITAFCCSRSAKGAGDLAVKMGCSLPSGLTLVAVPCAGSVSLVHLTAAFKQGADGVLVMTCHDGNCHSEYGNIYAHRRVEQLTDLLSQIGFEPERLQYRTLASNMGTEFAGAVSAFENTLRDLGPSLLKEESEK